MWYLLPIKYILSIRLSVKHNTLASYCLARKGSVACELRPLTVRQHSRGISDVLTNRIKINVSVRGTVVQIESYLSHIAQHQCNLNEIQNMKVLNEESQSEKWIIEKDPDYSEIGKLIHKEEIKLFSLFEMLLMTSLKQVFSTYSKSSSP